MSFSSDHTPHGYVLDRIRSEVGTARQPLEGIGVVLVVEDDALLRLNAIDMIEAAGFQVIEAANADAAIDVLESRNDVRLMFTDIDMPGSMDGLALARAVAERWPPIRIFATSGHFKVSERDLPKGGRFIPKPYRQHQIVDMLNECGTNS